MLSYSLLWDPVGSSGHVEKKLTKGIYLGFDDVVERENVVIKSIPFVSFFLLCPLVTLTAS